MKKKIRIKITPKAKMRIILDKLPQGLTMEEVKFAFVDKVVNFHEGNLTRAAEELNVSYRTICDWIHGKFPTTAESRGRGNPGKRDY
jgi:transcriptional regulator with PAS, ATPase and Fis domain